METLLHPVFLYIILMIALYGIYFEIINPGLILPGVAGLIFLLGSLYGLYVINVQYLGLFLLLLGIVCMITEGVLSTYFVFSVVGAIVFITGSLLMFYTAGNEPLLPWEIITVMAILSVAFFTGMTKLGVSARKRPLVSGQESMLGKIGHIDSVGNDTWVLIDGERWRAVSSDPLVKDDVVKVTQMEGLTAVVKKVDKNEVEIWQ